jgi:hypothetical protein
MIGAAALVLAACGTGETSTELGSAELAAYDAAAAEVVTAAATYDDAARTMASLGECASATAKYAATVEPVLERLRSRARDMDGAMNGFGEGRHADFECAAGAIRERFQAHLGAGCGAGLDVARENIARHCGEMQDLANHVRMRCAEAAELNGAPGWTGERGGMNGWDHEIPGCTSAPAADGPGAGAGECSGDCDPVRDRDQDRDGMSAGPLTA